MPDLNLYTDGRVTISDQTEGLQDTGKGFGGVQPWPVFPNWTPTGDGFGGDGGYLRGAWYHGGYLYMWWQHATASKRGVFRRQIVGDPPTHTTDAGFASVQAMFGAADTTSPFAIYDPVEEAVYVGRYNTAALTGIIGKWMMSSWPFTQANAEWIALDSSYTNYVAGQISYYPFTALYHNGKLYVSSGNSGVVFTLDASTGAILGYWETDPVYRYSYIFYLAGVDAATGYVVGGAGNVAGGSGALKRWDASDPYSWAAIDVVIQAGPQNIERSETYGRTPNALYTGAPYWGIILKSLPGQELLGFGSDLITVVGMSYYDSWDAIYRWAPDGSRTTKCGYHSAGRLGGFGGASTYPGYSAPAVIRHDGVTYLVGTAHGTPRITDVSGVSDKDGCQYLQAVGRCGYVAEYTVTTPMVLKRLFVDMDPSVADREMSIHPGKHRFEFNVNGQGWSAPRAGHELLRLDQAVNGKPAIPSLESGNVLQIRHTMTSGFFEHFLHQVLAAEGCEKSGTTLEIGSLGCIGMPVEVQPVLEYEISLPYTGKHQGASMSTIDVETFDPTNLIPRGIVNLVEGKGLPSAADEPRKVCLIAVSDFPDPSAAPAYRPVRVVSEQAEDGESGTSAVELFGAGSELHLMCRAAFTAYPGVTLYGVPIPEPALGTLATAELTVAGTATRAGEWTVVLHNTRVPVRVEGGSDPANTLEAVAKALASRSDLPIEPPDADTDVTDGTVAGTKVLTLSARHKGANGNFIDLFVRGGVTGQSLTASGFSGGTGDNAIGDSGEEPWGALNELATDRYHYIVVANTDTGENGNVEALKDHLERMADPMEGHRQQGLYGWVDSLSSAAGSQESRQGTAWLNSPRLQCVWSRGSSLRPGELAAAVAAHRAWMEGLYAAANTAGQVVVGVPRPRLPSDLPDAGELNEALHQGVTPLDIKATEMALVRSVTTRYLDEAGRENYGLLDTGKVTVSDYVADDIELKLKNRFGGFKLAPDSDAPVPARTATPETVRRSIIEWMREYQKIGLLRQVEEHLDEIRVEISDDVPGRLDFEIPEAVVNICAVTAGNLIRF